MERHEPPPRSGEVDGVAGEPAGPARIHEPRMDVALWRGHRALGGRLWYPGGEADASGAAGLPVGGVPGAQLGPQVADEADHDVAGVPTELGGGRSICGGRSIEPVAVAESAAAARSGNHSR